MTALCTVNYRANCTAWLEMTKSGKFFFVDFHCCECVCVCTCTRPTLVSLNTLRILPHCWNLKYQVKPAATPTDYSLLPRLCSLFWPLTRDTRSCNFTPLSVNNCASLAFAEAVLTDPWTKAVAWLTFNSCAGCLSNFTADCSCMQATCYQWFIGSSILCQGEQEQRICDEDAACVLSAAWLFTSRTRCDFALDVSLKTTTKLVLLFILSCTYNFNDFSCENTKSVRVSSSSAPCPTADP